MRNKTFSLIMAFIFASAALIIGCSDNGIINPNEHVTNNDVLAAKIQLQGSNDFIPNGGSLTVPPNRVCVFDAHGSTGNITHLQWIVKNMFTGVTIIDDTNWTITKDFTAYPDSFRVTLKVWNNLVVDSTWFKLYVNTGGQQGTLEIFKVSSQMLNNGKTPSTYYLPIRWIPSPPFNVPRIHGYHGRSWSGVSITLDTILNYYKFTDVSYENGGDKLNYSGGGSAWALNTYTQHYAYPYDNNFWLDIRNDSLYGWGKPAPVAPGNGDTSYLNGTMKMSLTATLINLFMNVRSGNFPDNMPQTPPYQVWVSTTGNYTNYNMSWADHTGYGRGSVLISTVGVDNIVKVRMPGCTISGSMWYVSNEDALVFVLVRPTNTVIPLAEAIRLGIVNYADAQAKGLLN